jgi:hypothetical protein
MVERSLSMREVRGSIPRTSMYFLPNYIVFSRVRYSFCNLLICVTFEIEMRFHFNNILAPNHFHVL